MGWVQEVATRSVQEKQVVYRGDCMLCPLPSLAHGPFTISNLINRDRVIMNKSDVGRKAAFQTDHFTELLASVSLIVR